MQLHKSGSIILLSITLASCGGGGGGSGNTDPVAATPLPASATTNSGGDSSTTDQSPGGSPSPTASTLVIDPEFDVSSRWTMEVSVNLPGIDDAFFSLCTTDEGSAEEYDVDYDACLIRAPLANGTYGGNIEVSNEFESLVGTLIYYDELLQPEYREFFISNGQPSIRWE